MFLSKFHIAQMDCPSEEQLIRLALSDFTHCQRLDFNIEKRELLVFHSDSASDIEQKLISLKLGAVLLGTSEVNIEDFPSENQSQTKLLQTVLLINAVFFVVESLVGWVSHSVGLMADGLDMLADAMVYGLALFAVGKSAKAKIKVSRLAGIFQLSLAVFGLLEVLRRYFLLDAVPDYSPMIIASFFALLANAWCLILLKKSKTTESHMKASVIFTSNDVIANIGVIVAAILVQFTESALPDLLVGTVVFGLVLKGAYQILKLQ
jgi:Co/Zn/Cd efflux system component